MDYSRLAIRVLIGAAIGFGYYLLIGCRTGTCLITGNPFIATGYGAMLGAMWGLMKKSKFK